MSGEAASEVGRAIAGAIGALRAKVGDDAAHVAVVVPSRVNGTLARRELALAMPHVRVTFVTPDELFSELAAGGMAAGGLAAGGTRREPPGWLRATLAGLVRSAALPEAYARVLVERGWLGALTSAIASLEAAGVPAETLGGMRGELELRGEALAVLLEGVREARAGERIAGPEELARLARAAIASGARVPANEPRAALLLGDVHGSRLVFEVLREWLARREVMRLAPGAFARLEPAPLGITEAAPDAETIAIDIAPRVTSLVRTLDSVREADEAVREVWRHVRAGVALDRIALVLPDASACGAVRDALARAGIPATFQVGPPLAETEAARFARLVLGIAVDDGSVASVYELLSMSSLRIRKVLGAEATIGRGSWRGILARCGAYRGMAVIARAVEKSAAEVAGREGIEEADRARRVAAHGTLLAAIEALRAIVGAMREERSTGEHARALRDVVATWWPGTADQRALVTLLETWGRSSAGPRIGIEAFEEAIEEALEGTAFLTGSLREASVRVLSPMQLVGASFEAVIATGLVEGRLPVRPGEDPILSDALIDAIEGAIEGATGGAGLLRSDARIGIERRRFASMRAAAAGALWISVPASDPENGRPLLPGSLLLEMIRERDPAAGYDALERELVAVGHVATRWPDDPADALGSGEHLLARLHGRDRELARRARSALVDHEVARRTLAELRGEDRVARGERSAELMRWAGFVDPEVLPCPGLDGKTVALELLRALVEKPEDFLRRTMLRAFRAPRLDESWDPVSWFFARRLMLDAAQAVLTRAGGSLAAGLRAEFDARRDETLERAGVSQGEVRDRLRRMSDLMLRALVRAAPVGGPVVNVSGAAIADDLPWRVEGGRARRSGSGLEWVVERTANKTKIDDQTGALIEAAAHGPAVSELRVIDLFGQSVPDDGAAVAGVLERVRESTRLARRGLYPEDREKGIAQLETWGSMNEVSR